MLYITFALDALFIEQTGNELVRFRFEKPEGKIFDLPLDLPDTEPVGERCKHLQRLARHVLGHRHPAGRRMPQSLQPRGQPQHDDAQVSGKRQQHFADVLGLRAEAIGQLRAGRCRSRLLLHMNELGGLDRQRGEVVAKDLGDHLLRAVQVLA